MRGWLSEPPHFLDIGPEEQIRQHCANGIQQIIFGIGDFISVDSYFEKEFACFLLIR
jgi:hypothetical protein